MDSGFIVRPAGRAAQTKSARSGAASVRDAVRPSLSTAQSVTAIVKPSKVGAEATSTFPKLAMVTGSREVIHHVLEMARRLTGQAPEETKQRVRAYIRRAPARREPKNLDLEV
jgi:hypothetical protein